MGSNCKCVFCCFLCVLFVVANSTGFEEECGLMSDDEYNEWKGIFSVTSTKNLIGAWYIQKKVGGVAQV